MRRLVAAVAIIVLAGCGGSSPAGPAPGTPPVAAGLAFDGVWQIDYRIAECSGLRHCTFLLGTTQRIIARLLSAGRLVAGVVSVGGDNVEVSGTIDATGVLVLHGVRSPVVPRDHGVEINRLELRGTEAGFSGAFGYAVSQPAAIEYPFVASRRSGPITSSNRIGAITPLDTSFRGTWSGRAISRDCSSAGWQGCYPLERDEVFSFHLTVTESGGRVSGLFREPADAVVEGSISGATLTLQGGSQNTGGGHTRVTTVRPSSFRRDMLGRLTGSLSIDMRWMWNDGRVSTSDFRVIELLNVVLQP